MVDNKHLDAVNSLEDAAARALSEDGVGKNLSTMHKERPKYRR